MAVEGEASAAQAQRPVGAPGAAGQVVEEPQASCFGLARVEHHAFGARGLSLRVSLARPMAAGPPDAVLYVLDAEPELFAVATVHLFGRTGYTSDDSPAASPLRRIAVVGVGHHPSSLSMGECGWDVQALRTLRRRDYWKDYQNLMAVLCDDVLPWAERRLGAEGLQFHRRAVLGCSLSGAFALRLLFLRPGLFGKFVLGSPSLQLATDTFELAERHAPEYCAELVLKGTAIFLLAGGLEDGPEQHPASNGIPTASRRMAAALRDRGVHVSGLHLLEDEDHASAKPGIVTRGMGWLEEQLAGRRFVD